MRSLLMLAVAIVAPAWAQEGQSSQPQPQSQSLTITRYDEDWSHPDRNADRDNLWTAPFKYIPIEPDVYLTTGLEFRLRDESFTNPSFGEARDDGYLWARAIPYADLHSGAVRAFVQPIVAYAAGVSPQAGPLDQTGVDLLQGFADVTMRADDATTVTLRAGRQMLSLGSERLVGTRYGPNVPLAFDGVRLLMTIGTAKISLLAVKPVTPGLDDFDDQSSHAKSLWGGYASLGGLDLYYLGYRNSQATYGGGIGRELRHSLGARLFGDTTDWHWNIEGVAQFGRFANETIGAWTLATEIGRRWRSAPLAPDATLRLNIVSGDRAVGDNQLATFNALFPKGKYFGELSPVGPYNIINVNPRVDVTLASNVSASLAAMGYWRYSIGDGVYDVPGKLIRAAGASQSRFIGLEAEVTLSWQATPELELSGSVSAFKPGDFIEETGSSRTTTLLGLESNFRF